MNVVNRVISEWGHKMINQEKSVHYYHLSSNLDETWHLFFSVFKPDLHFLHQLLKFEYHLDVPFFELLELVRRHIMEQKKWFSFYDMSQTLCLVLLTNHE